MNYQMNNANGNVIRIFNVTDDIRDDCYMIANQTRPRNAVLIHGMLANDVRVRNHILFVYMVNHMIYGFIKGHLMHGENPVRAAKVDWLFVDPSRHNGGIGTALMNAYVDYCIGCGVKRISVEPVPSVQAWKFYDKHGFKSCGMVHTRVKDLGR